MSCLVFLFVFLVSFPVKRVFIHHEVRGVTGNVNAKEQVISGRNIFWPSFVSSCGVVVSELVQVALALPLLVTHN